MSPYRVIAGYVIGYLAALGVIIANVEHHPRVADAIFFGSTFLLVMTALWVPKEKL